MRTNHLMDEQLQQIAEGAAVRMEERTHLKDCASCAEKLEQYRQLYTLLKIPPSFKLHTDFVHRVMKKLSARQHGFNPDYFWIILSSMIAAGIMIYFVGLQLFLKPLNGINTYLQQSLPLFWKPLNSFFSQLPIDWHHFLLGGTGLLFILIIDLFIKQVIPHTIKKG